MGAHSKASFHINIVISPRPTFQRSYLSTKLFGMMSAASYSREADHISAQESQFSELIAIIGMPRSGTTLAASIFDAHPHTVTCYEPWNLNSGAELSPEMTPEELITRFKLKRNPEANIFVLKETTIDLNGFQWLTRFLRYNAGQHRIRVVWSLRCYRHTYLSFVEGARRWWGHDDMEIGVDGYNRWVYRARMSTAALLRLYQEFPGVVYSYEAVTANPAEYLPSLMSGIGLEFSAQQLDYGRHISADQVMGDMDLKKSLRPISSSSVDKREQEWKEHEEVLAVSSGDSLRRTLDEFWQTVHSRALVGGTVPAQIFPPNLLSSNDRSGAANMTQPPPGHEYRSVMSSQEEWEKFASENPVIFNNTLISDTGHSIAKNGFSFRGKPVAPSQMDASSDNYREGFLHAGLNSRKRAVLAELHRHLLIRKMNEQAARVYAPEAFGGFADYLSATFPLFRGSEYIPDADQQRKLAPIEHQDLAALGYVDNSFDYVLVNDIFEHVPRLQPVLSEIARVLAPRGVLFATFPFAIKSEDHLIKARLLDDGSIDYLMEPEYHEDPVDEQGVLVFQLPGWNILRECKELGFEQASMVFLSSPARGILDGNISGIMVLKAQKSS
jgi:SAM-dependent methyltransferase